MKLFNDFSPTIVVVFVETSLISMFWGEVASNFTTLATFKLPRKLFDGASLTATDSLQTLAHGTMTLSSRLTINLDENSCFMKRESSFLETSVLRRRNCELSWSFSKKRSLFFRKARFWMFGRFNFIAIVTLNFCRTWNYWFSLTKLKQNEFLNWSKASKWKQNNK